MNIFYWKLKFKIQIGIVDSDVVSENNVNNLKSIDLNNTIFLYSIYEIDSY